MGAEIWTIWWVWGAFALVLAIAEVLIPGFVFLGFAIGAGATAIMLLLVGGPQNVAMLVLIFAVLSALGWGALRRIYGRIGQPPKTFDHDIND